MKQLFDTVGRRSCTRVVLLLLIGFQAVACHGQSNGPTGYGDCIFHPGTNGYATLRSSLVQDLNYQQDFSVEAALNIEACAAGGRWPNVLAKKISPPLADAGFALSINQGQFKTVGQQIYASVADGSQQASVSSRSYQGIVHAVMTWDVTNSVLRLYVNGGLEGSVTNTLINSANLTNSTNLRLGAPSYGQPLQRDILLARLWNRRLGDAEVTNLWTNFNAAGQHVLPAGFDRSALVSEWLMQDLTNATHLKDSQGTNYLQLQGTAALWQANGPLVLQFPTNGATGISKSVTLKVAGGLGSLGASPVRPLQYQLQIDEVSTFNSPTLKSSGWLAGYGTWKPVLKPATQYYWRAQVQDASLASASGFVATNSFVTKSTNTWYVRPGVYTNNDPDTGAPIAETGIYGTQDGTSYSNAWNGINSIVWGEGGVEAGDTVYICGMHYYTMSNAAWAGLQGLVYIPESGYSSDYPITIRMDLATDPGTLWGAAVNLINGGGTWSRPDANGVYSSANLLYSADYCLSGTNLVLLNRETTSTWQGDYGASFTANGIWYVKMPDGGSPAGRVCVSGFGYQFNLARSSYIRFYNCRLYNAPPASDIANLNASSDTQTQLPHSTYITFDGCDLRYDSEITPCQGNDHWTIRNSELSFGQYGVYTMLNNRATGANYLTVDNNYIHDLGTTRFPNPDGHGVGVQGGEGHLIQNNHIENTGSAIEFWTSSQPMRNHTIRYNFIKNIHITQNSGNGITISGDNTYSVPGLRTGFEIYGNIIMNTGLGGNQSWQGYGIDCGSPDFVDIYNNVIYQARTGIGVNSVNYPAQARVVNNIVVVNSTNRFLEIVGSGPSTNFLADYNLYFPVADASSPLLTVVYGSHDQHSVFANPSFVSTNPVVATDFMLAPTSKAIGAGTPIYPLYNFGGSQLVATNQAPNIGAFQSYVTVTPHPLSPPTNLRVVTN